MGKDIATVLFLLLIITILWYAQGGEYKIGPAPRQSSPQSRATTSLQDIERAQNQEISAVPSQKITKMYKNITISIAQVKTSDPKKEAVEVRYFATFEGPAINITGWKLKNKNSETFAIERGTELPYTGQVNPQRDIWLRPGQIALIVTGKSPIATSFLLNKCVGYLAQFRDFGNIITKQCPAPTDEPEVRTMTTQCQLYLRRLPRCFTPISTPFELDKECKEYVAQNVNYASCVEKHAGDKNFYQDKWIIYLEREKEIWDNAIETISIFDQSGNLVSEKSY